MLGGVVGQRTRCTGALVVNVLTGNTDIGKDLAYGARALFRQLLIEISRAGGVGMPDHQDFLRGRRLVRLLVRQRRCQRRQLATTGRSQLCRAHGKHLRRLDLGFNPNGLQLRRGARRGGDIGVQLIDLHHQAFLLGHGLQFLHPVAVQQGHTTTGTCTSGPGDHHVLAVAFGQYHHGHSHQGTHGGARHTGGGSRRLAHVIVDLRTTTQADRYRHRKGRRFHSSIYTHANVLFPIP